MKSKDKKTLFLLFSISLLIRITYLYSSRQEAILDINLLPGTDMEKFYGSAVRISEGLPFEANQPYLQAPLYFYLIALIFKISGTDYFNFLVFQTVIGSATTCIVFLLGKKLFDRKTGVIAACAAMIYGPFIFYEGILLRVTIIIFLSALFLLTLTNAIEKKGMLMWFFSGAILGINALCRANILILMPFIIVIAMVRLKKGFGLKRISVSCALFISGAMLFIVPVTLRNYIASDRLVLISSNGPITYAIGNSYDSTGAHMDPKKPLIPVSSIDFWKLQLKKFKLFWGYYEIPNNVNYYLFMEYVQLLSLFSFLSFRIFLSLGIAGIIVTFKGRGRYWPFYLFLLLFSASIIIFHCVSRFRQPVVPVLMLFSAAFIGWIIERWRQRQFRMLSIGAACAAIPFIMFSPSDAQVYVPANHHLNLAGVFIRQGNYKKAIYEEMLAFNDKQLIVKRYLPIAVSMLKSNIKYNSLIILEELIKIAPENSELNNKISAAYEKVGDLEKAVLHLKRYIDATSNKAKAEKGRKRLLRLISAHPEMRSFAPRQDEKRY